MGATLYFFYDNSRGPTSPVHIRRCPGRRYEFGAVAASQLGSLTFTARTATSEISVS